MDKFIVKKHSENGVESEAVFSLCENYRYVLSRVWNEKAPKMIFVGLNPSTADEMKNDPTVTRVIGFAKKWDFGGVIVHNLFAYRTAFPTELKKSSDPVGTNNDYWLKKNTKNQFVLVGWGNHGKFLDRSSTVLKFIKNPRHFGLTKSGEPKHPLYLRADSKTTLMKSDITNK